jgi:glyoxylase-like metal-dependent hydrolase (beta-lactamase superfamily II)
MISSRRKFLHSTAISGLGFSLFHQNLFAKLINQEPAFNMHPLRNNVGYFTERGGTIGWMVADDGIVVIDTQFPEQSRHLIDEMRKKSVRKIDLLINTHHHGDHTSGNIAYDGLTGTIIAHENSKKNQMRVARERNQEDGQLYPNTTFSKEWSKKIGSEMLTLRYFGPGHTDGDAIIHFENANIVHMGDLIFNRRFPFIDKSAGASIKNWMVILQETIKTFDIDTKYIFGHSAEGYDVIGTKKDILAMENYLTRVLETVQAAIKAGKSQEEIMKIESIKGADEWTGNGIQRSLSAAFEELS